MQSAEEKKELKNQKKPNRIKVWVIGFLGTLAGLLLLLLSFKRNSVKQQVKLPDAEDYLEKQEKVLETVEEVNKGPTEVEPTVGTTLDELKKEYEKL